MATWSLHLSYSKHNSNLWKSSSFRTENISRRSNMEIPHSVSLLDGLELCTSHVRSISTKPLTRAAELCDAVPKGACLAKINQNPGKFCKFFQHFVKIQQQFQQSSTKNIELSPTLRKLTHSARVPRSVLWSNAVPLDLKQEETKDY